MKKMILSLLVVMTSISASAMSSSRARQEAWFLTDKMAYELYLTEGQMEDVYEINYDYFRALGSVTGIYNSHFDRRSRELQWVLTPWQWRRYVQIDYFVNPVRVLNNAWYFNVYTRYSRGINYYNKPVVYKTYIGGHLDSRDYYKNRQNIHLQAVKNRRGNSNVDRHYTTPSYVNKKDDHKDVHVNVHVNNNQRVGSGTRSEQVKKQNQGQGVINRRSNGANTKHGRSN